MSASSDCIFCKILTGEIPSETVDETELSVAFRDVSPQAPTHVLVIPRTHLENAAEVAEAEPSTLADMFRLAQRVADAEGLAGYRTIFNTGAAAQQTVFHAHLHVIGGRSLTWPPG